MNEAQPALLFDECCEAGLVAALRASKVSADCVIEVQPGLDDTAVLDLAARTNRILVTEDKDFGELAVRHGLATNGVVLIRMPDGDVPSKAARLIKLVRQFGDRLSQNYTVVQPDKFRFRRLS